MRTDAEHAARMAKKKAVQDRIVAERDGEKGLLIVHTGAGKGKTTAALGMLVRAAGHGMTVGMIQFVKGAMTTGEAAIVATLPGVEFRAMGDGFTWDTQDRSADIASAGPASNRPPQRRPRFGGDATRADWRRVAPRACSTCRRSR